MEEGRRSGDDVNGWEGYLHRVNLGGALSYQEAFDYTAQVLAIDDSERRMAQLGVLLTLLLAKGPALAEVEGAIDAALSMDSMDARYREDHSLPGPVVGVAGSGKKGIKTCNISTMAVMVASSLGRYVAKVVSSGTSSASGSADTLSALGVHIPMSVQNSVELLAQSGVGLFPVEARLPRFDSVYGGRFFAPHILSAALPALLLPLRVDGLVYGLSHPRVDLSIKVLERYGVGTNLAVVSSCPDGSAWIDELSLDRGPSYLAYSSQGASVPSRKLDLAELLGVPHRSVSECPPSSDPQASASMVVKTLAGRGGDAVSDTVAANAALLMTVTAGADGLDGLRAAFDAAGRAIRSGRALEKLGELVEASGGSRRRLEQFAAE